MQLIFGKPGFQELSHQFQGAAALVLDFQAQPHQWFRHVVIRFFSTFFAADVSFGFEIAQLLGTVAFGDKGFFGDFLDGQGPCRIAQALHQLPLLVRQRPHALLKIGRHLFGQHFESRHQIVKRFPGQKLCQQDIHPIVSARQMMEGADSIAGLIRIQESDQVGLVLLDCNFADQSVCVVDRQRGEVVGVEKPEERFLAAGNAREQLLGRAQGGNAARLLKESPQLLLPHFSEAGEGLIQILRHEQQVAMPQISDDRVQDGQRRIVQRQPPHGGFEIGGELIGVFVGQRLRDSERQMNEP